MKWPRSKLAWTGWVAGLGGAAVLVALLVAWSGVYNVAATAGHQPWIEWFLELGMRRSVNAQSIGIETRDIPLDDSLALGAAHYHAGCAPCHGGPGLPRNSIYTEMLPAPPRLEEYLVEWSRPELFWIVKHGIKYAGMPAWSGVERDDEVWALVAFLKEYPSVDEPRYRELVSGNADTRMLSPELLAEFGPASLRLTACARCHETSDAPPTSKLIPRLAGQSREYLEAALTDYRSGRRQSGFMEPVANELERTEIAVLADYYARLAAPAHAEPLADVIDDTDLPEGDAERGRLLATRGDPARRLPACEACHGTERLARYPQLDGQPEAYLRSQLQLWQAGGRADSATGQLMSAVATRLSPQQAADLARYYASRPPFGSASDESALGGAPDGGATFGSAPGGGTTVAGSMQ